MASFEKRESGLWSVRFRILTPSGEKMKRLSGYKTKAAANRAMIEYIQNAPIAIQASEETKIKTFRELAEKWLQNTKTRTRESSYLDFRARVENHILPYFGRRTITSITAGDILSWQSGLANYSFNYKKTLRTTLSSIFKFGERYYELSNPMTKVEPLRNVNGKKEMLCWTLEEFKQFINYVKDPKYKCFFHFLYITGCRKGEALALGPEDLNKKENCILISKSVSNKTNKGAFTITAPKNAGSIRKIEIPKWLMQDIEKIYDPTLPFVFGGKSPFSTTQIDRVFSEGCKKAGIKKIRIHDLRHSCASLLLSNGLSIVAVSKRLGHTDVEQTLNTYSHIMPTDEEKIIQVFEKVQ